MRIKKTLKRALVTVLAVSMVLQTPNLSALATEGLNDTGATVSGSDNRIMLLSEDEDNITYTDVLNDLVAGVEIKEDKESDVTLTEMEKGRTYYLELTFTEADLKQLDHKDGVLEYNYTFPSDIGTLTMVSNPEITIQVKDKYGVEHDITLTLSFSETESKLTVQFDTDSDAYGILKDSGNVNFEIGMELDVADDFAGDEIDFGNGVKVQIVDQKSRINISGSKTWNDDNDRDGKRPDKITVNLYADGALAKTVEVTPDAGGNWSYEFTDLLEFREDGTTPVVYTIGENSVDGYTSIPNGYNLTNTHTTEKINISGNKTWNDNNDQDGLRPDNITVTLYANGAEVTSTVVTPDANGNWFYNFNDLPKYENGQEIIYTLSDSASGYTASQSGYNLVNTHTPETVTVSGTKTWNDANNQDGIRPESITVNLLADGTVIKSQAVDASGSWSYSFEGLPKYKDGVEITYTIQEVPVKGYESSVSGYNLVNTYVPDEQQLVMVDKTGYVNDDGVVVYTVTVTSIGNNTNVVIEDTILDTSFVTLNNGSISASSNKGGISGATVEYKAGGNGFTYTVPSMQAGEVITLTYTADVDYLKLGNNTVIEENQVVAKSDEDPEGTQDTLVISITPNPGEPITKTNFGASGSGENTEVTWTITVNDNNWMSLGGETITDTVTADLANVLSYSGAGIQVVVKDKNGQTVDTRNVPWNQLSTTSSADAKQLSWTYNVPAGDTEKYTYVITYTTKVDMDYAIGNVYLANTAKLGNEYATSNTTVEQTDTERIPAVDKYVARLYKDGETTKVDWSIAVTVPAQGLDICQVLEQAPEISQNSTLYMDKLDTSKLAVSGLQGAESYSYEWLAHDWAAGGENMKLKLVFYKDAAKTTPGLNATTDGKKRTVTINVTTIVDDAWIEMASETGVWSGLADHTNNVSLTANDKTYNDNAVVKVIDSNDKYLSKGTDAAESNAYSGTTTINGVEYPYYQFNITLKGVTTDEIIVYDQIAPLSMDNWKLYNGVNEYNTYYNELKILAADETWGFWYGEDEGGITATMPTSSTEKLKFTVDVPKKTDGSYYKYYQIIYTLIPKDEAAVNKLKDLTLDCEEGTLKLTNTATWEGLSTTYDVDYTYDAVSKVTLKPAAIGDYVATYQITVNPSGIKMNNGNDLEIIDTMHSSLRFLHETLVVKADGVVLNNDEFSYTVEDNVLTLHVPDEKAIVVTYDTRVVGPISTNNEPLEYSNTVKVGSASDGDTVNNSVVMNATGSGLSTNHIIYLQKMDAGDNSIKLSGAEFKLQEYDDVKGWVDVKDSNRAVVTATTDADGKATFYGSSSSDGWWLAENTRYRVVEIQAPAGYDASGVTKEFVIMSTPTQDGEYVTGDTLYITNEKGITSVSGSKTWNDNNNQDGLRPESITINLLKDGNKVDSKEVTANDNWSWTFANLEKYDGTREIVYTITEEQVAGYDAPYVEGYNVTNTRIPEKTSVSGVKTWVDNDDQDGIRPDSITINLLADGTKIDEQIVEADNQGNWEYSFIGLPKYRDGGVEIVYTITEDAVAGYETPVINGYDVTNKYTPETISVSGAKTWDDANDQDGKRPDSIIINLLADGTEVDEQIVEADNQGNWEYSFTDLPKYRDGGVEIVYTITEDAVENYIPAINGFNITNSYTPDTTSVSGSKTWADNNDQDGIRPDSITINLLADGVKVDDTEVTATDNWSWNFTGLTKYKDGGVEIVYTITEEEVDGYTAEVNGYNVTNTHIPETTSVSGVKTWADNDDQDGIRPDSITINLLADGVEIDDQIVEADANGDWKYSFTDLPKYKDGGTEIIYTITEDTVAGYEAPVINGYDVTNKHTPGTTSVSGVKTWDDADDQDGIRPDSITINLLADGTKVDSKEVKEDGQGNWEYSFTGLPKYRDGGVEIVYTITEDIVENYTSSIVGFNITNSHTPGTVNVAGSKTWVDNDNQDGIRPDSITINLLANGTKIDSQIVEEDANGNWSWNFADLPKYENGEEIEYTITEEAVAEYTTEVSGYNVTNSYTPETTDITITKTWDDSNDQDGIRPENITVHLWNGTTEVATKTISGTGNTWSYTFTDLPKYENGVEIVYTVTEDAVTGYTKSESGLTITNTHEPETTDITISKTWDDSNDQDGIRPEKIVVRLLADGVEEKSAEISGTGNIWTYTFTDLPKYKDGTEIVYTITEDAVADYDAPVINGYDVTNKYTPETIDIDITKTWVDGNNQDGIRPTSITVRLLADGTQVNSATISEISGAWTHTFSDLPKYRDGGKEIKYTISEDAITGYEQAISGNMANGFTITNTHTPETTNIYVEKKWNDAENQDGKRPTAITVSLLKAVVGEATITVAETKEISAETGWKYSFKNLPVYENGKQLTWSIVEVQVAGYAVPGYTQIGTNDGVAYTITNTYTPETTSIAVTKNWDDEDDQDGKRPTSITVNLLANGVEVDSATITEATGGAWTYEFTDLPKYANGQEIVYTVTEDVVTDYTADITGNAANGYTITNKYTPGKTSVTVTKVWDDAGDQDGLRKNAVEVQLYEGEEGSKTAVGNAIVLDETNNWTYTWTDLDAMKDGATVNYSVDEIGDVLGYEVQVIGNATHGYTITNKHIPLTTEVEVTKVWDDANNQDGKRPSSIKVQLYANNVMEGTAVLLSEANGWTYQWTGLAKKNAGTDITYTVKEVEVPEGYTTDVTGNMADGYTITNTHTPEVVEVKGSKTWADNNNLGNIRPDSITVYLLVNGTVKETKTVTAAENWSWDFGTLPKYEAGKEIEYTITEDAVPDYSAKVEGFNITNITPAVYGSVLVTKKLVGNGMDIKTTGDTFYVALYADNDGTMLVSEVKSLNVANDSSSASVEFTNVEVGKTYYVRECDVNGKAITNGETKDGIAFVATFENDNKVALELKGEQAEVTLINTFEELPEDYYISGELQITKKLLGADGSAKNSSEVFYAGIFEDAAYTKLSTLVSDNIVELKLNGNSQTTENVQVTIWGTEQTLYITEVDMNGVPVKANNDFGYIVTVDGEKAVFDLVNDSVKVTITNREVEEVLPTPTPTPEPGVDPTPTPTPEPGTDPTPTPTPEPGTDPTPTPTPGTDPTPTPTPDTTPTPTPVPGGQTSPKTGDASPVEGMLWLFLVTASVVGVYSFGYSRNKRKVK